MENMQLWDSRVYLPNDILHKVDIASMAVGLEVRVPLLDHRFYEHAWRVPERSQGGTGTAASCCSVDCWGSYLPDSLFDRPKRGFSAPLDDWLAWSLTRLGGVAAGAKLS